MPDRDTGTQSRLLGALRERLKRNQTNYDRTRANSQFAVESYSLVVLALRNHCGPEYIQALGELLRAQNQDGSWPAFSSDDAQGCWVTALAVLALMKVRQPSGEWERGLRWLLCAKGREATWLWRWKFRSTDSSVKFDPAKYGWSWVPDTTSWVIPTAFSLLAVQYAEEQRLANASHLKDRINLGTSMLLDRMCPGGGWNAGNSVAFGVPYSPYIDATSIALLALQAYEYEGVNLSFSWLVARLPACPSPYSLAWGILALMAYPGKGPNFSDALLRATDALIARLEKSRGPLDTSTLAICALALEAVEGKNAFTVRA